MAIALLLAGGAAEVHFPRLAERRQQLAGSLSGGEQQMLAIARSLMGRPTVLLLDEPSLARLHRDGLTLPLVEQNATAALANADRAVVLETGRVRLAGSAAELRHEPELQALYLGE